MKIALVAPAFGQTGGPEVVVQNIAETFLENHIAVTLFAPGDWKTPYPFIPTIPQGLWGMSGFSEQSEWERRNLIFGSQTAVLRHQENFDLIHLHSQRSAYAVAIGAKIPVVLTLHSRISPGEFEQLQSVGVHTVGLTQSQVGNLPVDATISNGLPLSSIAPSFEPGEYLLAVGRLNMQKGVHQAIEIAKRAKKKLIIIGRIGISEDRQGYFAKYIEPAIDNKQVILIESVSREEMYQYFQRASFLLFPITSPESNPLVVMEALACGTPVLGTTIAPLLEMFPGSEEVALFSDSLDELAAAASHPERFDRVTCRRYAEKMFDSRVMANEYIALYRKILDASSLSKF